jgi:hypothetical protein
MPLSINYVIKKWRKMPLANLIETIEKYKFVSSFYRIHPYVNNTVEDKNSNSQSLMISSGMFGNNSFISSLNKKYV